VFDYKQTITCLRYFKGWNLAGLRWKNKKEIAHYGGKVYKK